MTTRATVPDQRRWWQYAGPWPLFPVADAIVAALVALSARSFLMSAQSVPMEILVASIFGLIIFVILELARRYLPRLVRTFPGYLATILVAVASATLVRFAQGYVNDYADLSAPQDIAFSIFRTSVAVIIIQAIIGALTDRLQRQVDATQEAYDVVEAQAEALLRADEEVRRSVATLLHDRVQGGLLAACLRLQSIAQEAPASRADVDAVIHELEQLRTLDVRRAVRTLSPSLKDIDLETAVNELVEPYTPPLAVTISIPRNAISDHRLRLAAYRIIEQGLLNAIAHGQAQHIAILVTAEDDDLVISVLDDGPGVPAGYTPGFGTTLIDTWCRSVGGTWALRSIPAGGAELVARIPAQAGPRPAALS
jgi:signal transduction histidine kinase